MYPLYTNHSPPSSLSASLPLINSEVMYDADPVRDPVWAPGKNQPFNVWLGIHKPSRLKPDGDQWISIYSTAKTHTDLEADEQLRDAADRARTKVGILEKRMIAIQVSTFMLTFSILRLTWPDQKNAHLPISATHVGQKTKAVAETEAREELIADLKILARQSTWMSGKWLVHPKAHEVDLVWSTIARSVLSGPLRKVGVLHAKVGTTGDIDSGGKPVCEIRIHVVDAWNPCSVRKVLETLLVQHGICPTAVKADLYTAAGITSDNPYRLRSTIWRPDELTSGGAREIRRLSMQFAARTSPSPGSSSVDSPSERSPLYQSIERIILKPPPYTANDYGVSTTKTGAKRKAEYTQISTVAQDAKQGQSTLHHHFKLRKPNVRPRGFHSVNQKIESERQLLQRI